MSKNKKKAASNKKAAPAARKKEKNAKMTAAPAMKETNKAAAVPAKGKAAQVAAAQTNEQKAAKTAVEPAEEKAVKAAAATEDVKAQEASAPANPNSAQTEKENTERAGFKLAGNKFFASLKNFNFKRHKAPKPEKAEKAEKQETGAPAELNKAKKAGNAPAEELEKENQLLNLKKRLLDLNPVFIKIVAAVPLLGAAVSLKNGILLSCVMILTVVLLNLLLIPIYRFIPNRYRPAVSFLAAGVVITPLYAIAHYFSPSIASNCSIYLPLIAVSALALCEKQHFGKKYVVPKTALDAFFNGLGFAFAAIIISVLREIIANGTLYDRPLPYISEAKFKLAAYPAGAFILLAVFAALFRKIFNYNEGKGDDML